MGIYHMMALGTYRTKYHPCILSAQRSLDKSPGLLHSEPFRYAMYLHHTWFDPTSLMSRNVEWGFLPTGNHLESRNIVEKLKAGLLQEQSMHFFDAPKKRGRQKQQSKIDMVEYPLDILQHLGEYEDADHTHTLYVVSTGSLILGFVGVSIQQEMVNNTPTLVASLDAIMVLPQWRRRGLAQSIASHAGWWCVDRLQHVPGSHVCRAVSHGEVSASLANAFYDGIRARARLLGKDIPEFQWAIAASDHKEKKSIGAKDKESSAESRQTSLA